MIIFCKRRESTGTLVPDEETNSRRGSQASVAVSSRKDITENGLSNSRKQLIRKQMLAKMLRYINLIELVKKFFIYFMQYILL